MRTIIFPLIAATLFASSAHAANTPTQAQIQAAVDAGVKATSAKSSSSTPMPLAIKVFDVVSCKPSPEVKEEVVCLVGTSTSRRDAYTVLPLRQKGDSWVGVERKDAVFPPPTPAEAQAAMRIAAEELLLKNPEAAKDPQVEQARTTMKTKVVRNCGVERKTGYLNCEVILSVPGQEEINTDLKFAWVEGKWAFVGRK